MPEVPEGRHTVAHGETVGEQAATKKPRRGGTI